MNYNKIPGLPAAGELVTERKKTANEHRAATRAILGGTMFADEIAQATRLGKIALAASPDYLGVKKAYTKETKEAARKKKDVEATGEAAVAKAEEAQAEREAARKAEAAPAEEGKEKLLESLRDESAPGVLTEEEVRAALLRDPEGLKLAAAAEAMGRNQAQVEVRMEAIGKQAALSPGSVRGLEEAAMGARKTLMHAGMGAGIGAAGNLALNSDPDESAVSKALKGGVIGGVIGGGASHFSGKAVSEAAHGAAKDMALVGNSGKVEKFLQGAGKGGTADELAAFRSGRSDAIGNDLIGRLSDPKGTVKLTREHANQFHELSKHHTTLETAARSAGETALADAHLAHATEAKRIGNDLYAHPDIDKSGGAALDQAATGKVREFVKDSPFFGHLIKKTKAAAEIPFGELNRVLETAGERGGKSVIPGLGKRQLMHVLLGGGVGGAAGALSDEDHRARNAGAGAALGAATGFGAGELAHRAVENSLAHDIALMAHKGGDNVAKIEREMNDLDYEHVSKAQEVGKRILGLKIPPTEKIKLGPGTLSDLEALKAHTSLLGGGAHDIHFDIDDIMTTPGVDFQKIRDTHAPADLPDSVRPAFGRMREKLTTMLAADIHGRALAHAEHAARSGASAKGVAKAYDSKALDLIAKHPLMAASAGASAGAGIGSLGTGGVRNSEDKARDIKRMQIGGAVGGGTMLLPALLGGL